MSPFYTRLRSLSRSAGAVAIILCAVLLTACGGGGGSSDPAPAPAPLPPPPPPPPPAPSGISFDLDGTATKGLILGGTVRVFDANDPTVELATGITSTVNGSFDLAIGSSKAFEGGAVKVIVTGGTGATMVCDAPSGCGRTAFGDTFAIGDDFELSAIIEAPANDGAVTVNVSALTTLAAALAEANVNGGEIDKADLDEANQKVANIFGLTQTDLWRLSGLDVTREKIDVKPTTDELRAAFMNAGILEAMLEGNGTLDQRLNALVTEFVENDGQLILNEGSDAPSLISVEDIVEAAVSTSELSPLGAPFPAFGGLRLDLIAPGNATPDTLSGQMPPKPVISASVSKLSFSGLYGGIISGVTIDISGKDVPWKIASDVEWLRYDEPSGTGNSTILVYPDSRLAKVGVNNGTLIIKNRLSGQQISIPIDFTVGDVLGLSPSVPIEFQVVHGATDATTKRISLTGKNVSWDSKSDQSWASITPVKGTSPSLLDLTVDPTGLPTGTHTANITIFDTNFNQKRTLQIKVMVEPRRLEVAETGVSLSDFPSKSILRREIDVTDNLGKPLEWSASSNAAWLTVSATGQTGGVVTLQADPTGLTPNALYLAEVELTAVSDDEANVEHVNVSLWVGDTDPDARTEIAVAARNIVADPMRPYVYVNKSDYENSDTDVEIFNAYTGESVGVIEGVTANNGVMAVSPDGALLYVYDKANYKIVPVDLSDFSVQEGWIAADMDSIIVNKINGKEIIFTGAGQAFDADTHANLGADFGKYAYSNDNSVAVSKNGETLCLMDRGLSPFSLYCFGMSYFYLDGGHLSMEYHGDVAHGVGSNGMDAAISDDGTLAYTASGAPYQFNFFDTTTMAQVQTLAGGAYPTCAEIDTNGVFYGGIRRYSNTDDVWSYDKDGNQISIYALAGYSNELLDRQMVISGDGRRLIGATQGDFIAILSTD